MTNIVHFYYHVSTFFFEDAKFQILKKKFFPLMYINTFLYL
jgi:hypothetical protein